MKVNKKIVRSALQNCKCIQTASNSHGESICVITHKKYGILARDIVMFNGDVTKLWNQAEKTLKKIKSVSKTFLTIGGE